MHVYALPAAQKAALAQGNAPRIGLKVTMTATVLAVDHFTYGVPVFAGQWVNHTLDLSDRLANLPSITQSIPIWPGSTSFQASEIELEIINTDGYIACLQTGGMVRLANIDQATVTIEAVIDAGAVPNLMLYKGRVVGPPAEERGLTIFTVMDAVWDAARSPVYYEDFAQIGGDQSFYAYSNELPMKAREVTTTYGEFCALHGIFSWNGNGEAVPTYANSNPAQIDLRTFGVKNKAKPGVYVISFIDSTTLTILHPDNQSFKAGLDEDIDTPALFIPKTSWTSKQGLGVTITITINVTYAGNPVTIARNFIEKALLQNWGDRPGQTGQVLMDIAGWDALERRFQTYQIFLTATNPDNAAWNMKRGESTRQTPVNCLELAQQALDHIGATLIMRRDGLISVSSPYLDGGDIWEIKTNESITDLKIARGETWNFLTLQYAMDGNAYAASHEVDIRLSDGYIPNDRTLTMPSYKASVSYYRALWLALTYSRKYSQRQHTITVKMIPQMALPITCGDKLYVVSDTQPMINLICTVTQVTITVRGECELQLAPIQQYEGRGFKMGTAQAEVDNLW
jgi:hypothetical protein